MTRRTLRDVEIVAPTYDQRLGMWCARLTPTYPGRFFDTRSAALAWVRKKRRAAVIASA